MSSLESLSKPPDFTTSAVMIIETLSPLSMVVQMPGKYYRSQSAPSHTMLYGLLENALGWHIGDKDRTEILKQVRKQHGIVEAPVASGVGFQSLLQFHVRFGAGMRESEESLLRYDDLWSQHLRTSGDEAFKGSREHDVRAIPLMNATRTGDVKLTDREGARTDEAVITNFKAGDVINYKAVRHYFPRYYPSPTPREYVEPRTAYRYQVATSASLAAIIAAALEDPVAPLYLGSNDGWVEATFKTVSEAV